MSRVAVNQFRVDGFPDGANVEFGSNSLWFPLSAEWVNMASSANRWEWCYSLSFWPLTQHSYEITLFYHCQMLILEFNSWLRNFFLSDLKPQRREQLLRLLLSRPPAPAGSLSALRPRLSQVISRSKAGYLGGVLPQALEQRISPPGSGRTHVGWLPATNQSSYTGNHWCLGTSAAV